MVSSGRWAASPTSSCSSSSEDSWESEQPQKTADVDRRKGEQKRAERLPVDDERELARRVLEDLEGLYFDEDSDDESGDEDEIDSGSEVSSRGRAGGKSAGGMTLEELTVAVNAAIEYHLPTKAVVAKDLAEHSPCKPDENACLHSDDHQSRPRSRCQRKDVSRESSRGGGHELELFQEMLERKEQQFYAMKAARVAAEEKEALGRQAQRTAQSNVNQQQQTTTYLRDQATETEECPHYPALDASFAIAAFETPPHSLSPSVPSGYAQAPSELPVAVGPTLADLANVRRRSERAPSQEPGSSWSSLSSSTSRAGQSLRSSYTSECSRASNRSCSSSSSGASRRSSRASSKCSATSSKRSQHGSHGGEYQPSGLLPESSITKASERHITAQEDRRIGSEQQAAPPPAIPDPQVPHSPTRVSWELDLSNFSP